ncbi:hypothetical protein BI308_21710 [Roseofilum reptotaenium AO1-A]|uniref:Uncharacterized protein n=1 Tax=Roseofilum reptotaenium AO1-A TaxID=1925591 RepID=A0A1L9QL93_9CYAN|nr:hypothetical protein BI308_21710 [Roseofilum reptotaenium AO1-A]
MAGRLKVSLSESVGDLQKCLSKSKTAEEEKEENRKKARERIFVEYLIRQLNKFRVVGERFRLWRPSYERIIRGVWVNTALCAVISSPRNQLK